MELQGFGGEPCIREGIAGRKLQQLQLTRELRHSSAATSLSPKGPSGQPGRAGANAGTAGAAVRAEPCCSQEAKGPVGTAWQGRVTLAAGPPRGGGAARVSEGTHLCRDLVPPGRVQAVHTQVQKVGSRVHRQRRPAQDGVVGAVEVEARAAVAPGAAHPLVILLLLLAGLRLAGAGEALACAGRGAAHTAPRPCPPQPRYERPHPASLSSPRHRSSSKRPRGQGSCRLLKATLR